MAARDVFVRMVRAGGVALWAVTAPLAFLAVGAWHQNPANHRTPADDGTPASGSPWPWATLLSPALGALLALAAPRVARFFRWADASALAPPTVRRLRIPALLCGLTMLGVGFIEVRIRARLLGGFTAHESGFGARVVGAVVPSVIVAYGLARASVFGSVSRAALLTAVLRAGGLIGLAGTLGPLVDDLSGRFIAFGGRLDEDDLPFIVAPMVTSLVLLAWTTGAGRAVGTDDAEAEPAAPRHVFAGVAATLAAALVGPIAGMVSGWRWRVAMYAAAEAEAGRERSAGTLVHDFGGVLFLDGLPGPAGFAKGAAVFIAGFTVLVVIAAVAGRRREISR